MIGQRCHAAIALTIAKPHEPTLCPTWLPGFALVCHECGTKSPQARIAAFVDDPHPSAGVMGDVVKALAKGTHNNGVRRHRAKAGAR